MPESTYLRDKTISTFNRIRHSGNVWIQEIILYVQEQKQHCQRNILPSFGLVLNPLKSMLNKDLVLVKRP